MSVLQDQECHIVIERGRFIEWIMAQHSWRSYNYRENTTLCFVGCPVVQYLRNKYPSITSFRVGLVTIQCSAGALAIMKGFNITNIIPPHLRGVHSYKELQDYIRTNRIR